MSLGEHALKPRGWILLLFSKQNRAVTWSCNTDLSKSYNTICSRHESCDVPTALMSITPNLCCDETKLRRIHLPDKMMEEKNWHPSSRLWSLTLWFKNLALSFLFLRSGSIHSVWIQKLQLASGNSPYIPHSIKHRLHRPPHCKYLQYFPILTSTWCNISLWWIFCGGKGREEGTPGESELSLLKHRLSWVLFPHLYRVLGKQKW